MNEPDEYFTKWTPEGELPQDWKIPPTPRQREDRLFYGMVLGMVVAVIVLVVLGGLR